MVDCAIDGFIGDQISLSKGNALVYKNSNLLKLSTGLPSSVCVVDCAINDFIGDQISLSKGDALGF